MMPRMMPKFKVLNLWDEFYDNLAFRKRCFVNYYNDFEVEDLKEELLLFNK